MAFSDQRNAHCVNANIVELEQAVGKLLLCWPGSASAGAFLGVGKA